MAYLKSWRFHYDLGKLYGRLLRAGGGENVANAIVGLDEWAAARERKQSGKKPGEPLSSHQLKEAAAWGAGARKTTGVVVAYPSPAYPEGYEWVESR